MKAEGRPKSGSLEKCKEAVDGVRAPLFTRFLLRRCIPTFIGTSGRSWSDKTLAELNGKTLKGNDDCFVNLVSFFFPRIPCYLL